MSMHVVVTLTMMAGLVLQQIYIFISMLYLVKKCFKDVTSYIGTYTATLVICLFAVYMCILIVLNTKIKNCIEIYDEQR